MKWSFFSCFAKKKKISQIQIKLYWYNTLFSNLHWKSLSLEPCETIHSTKLVFFNTISIVLLKWWIAWFSVIRLSLYWVCKCWSDTLNENRDMSKKILDIFSVFKVRFFFSNPHLVLNPLRPVHLINLG